MPRESIFAIILLRICNTHICGYIIAFMRYLDWDDLRFFLAVVAGGSLSAAGRELSVNTTTVLRRIGNLEEALEARLFERLRSGYELTQDGARLLQALEPVDQRLSSLVRDFQAGGGSYRGIVKLGAGEVIAGHLLAPAMQRLRMQLPDIAVNIQLEPSLSGPGAAPRVFNALRDVDIALRLARPTQGDMLVRRIGDVAYGLYATADYVKKFGQVPVGGYLKGHQIIGFSEDDRPLGPLWWLSRAEREGDVVMRAAGAGVRANAALGGDALTALPCFYADGIAGLIRLVGPDIVGSLELWLLTRNDLAQLAHVRAVMDFLIGEVKRQSIPLAGA